MTSAHLDYETLAELAEGLLESHHAASADAHLADCAECRERSTEISEVSRLLAEASVPPMPAELATRIDAAIAAEMPPIAELTQMRSRWYSRRLQVLSAAAAATVLVGGGITVTQATLSGEQLAPSAVGSASRPSVQDRADHPAYGKGEVPSLRAEGVPFAPVRTGTDYRRATLAAQIRTTVRRPAAPAGAGPGSATLRGCISRIGQDRRPVLVDLATFEGDAATLIVLAGSTPERLDAWLVGPGCSADRSEILEHTQLDR